jgi:hypothetical protein
MPLLNSPDLIFLVFYFLVLGIIKEVFLDNIFLFNIESSLLLFSILLTLYLVWYSDLYYLLEVLGLAYFLFLLDSSYLVILVLLVLLVVFLLGFIKLALFFLAGSGWVKAKIIIGAHFLGLSQKAGKGLLL